MFILKELIVSLRNLILSMTLFLGIMVDDFCMDDCVRVKGGSSFVGCGLVLICQKKVASEICYCIGIVCII